MSIEHADLTCERCGATTEHELHYAGRLLESVQCTRCGHHIQVSHRALVPAYLHDLERRIASKPQRMYRRALREPERFLRSLPGAVARQPAKFAREFWRLVRR
jgi:DNA-directed RNA polymerase subunit RPC12/RpoP